MMMVPSGATRVCFMVGQPVDKARTPTVFNQWAARTGHDLVMVGLSIDAAGLPLLFQTLRHCQNCVGAVVTYPHKQAVFAALDEADPPARFNQACNVVRRQADGRLVGTMTDGIGCVSAMKKNGAEIEGADILLIGAGGAGSAIAHELARRGAGRLVVVDLSTARREGLIGRLIDGFRSVEVLDEIPADFRFDVVCNATPVGMKEEEEVPFGLDRIPPHGLVVDIVPTPALTPWLRAARARGLRIQSGPEMVAAQLDHVIGHLLDLPPAMVDAAGGDRTS